MYEHLCVPVDLAHPESLDKALKVAADLAGLYGSKATLMAVSGSAPSVVAHNPEEFAAKLSAFAETQGEILNVTFESLALHGGDPAVDLEKLLNRAIHDTGVDLVVMASHIPRLSDFVFRSHAGYVARHTDVSVFVVR